MTNTKQWKSYIKKRMSNKDLVNTLSRIRKEKAHPETYGKDGTSRYIPSSEFWGGLHTDLKTELKRRQKLGLIKKTAGKTTRRNPYSMSFKYPRLRF